MVGVALNVLEAEVRESEGIRTYLTVIGSEDEVRVLYLYQPLDDRPYVLAIGILITPDRYELYKTAILESLHSLKMSEAA